MEFKGFDDLSKHLEEAQRAAESLDGELCALQFNPADPNDVRRAIQEMERAVGARFLPYKNNPFIQPFIEASKQNFREQIEQKAEEARRKL